jgi:eukaryotic-like serine/threonine-protein kinase
VTANGESRLNTRQLDQSSAIEMTGTEGARGPFFSPDGQWVAFWAARKLKKIAVAGGPPQILCEASDLLGGSWGDDGSIVAAISGAQLSRISPTGGLPMVIADLSAESAAPRWPQVLPGAQFVLFTAVGATGPNAATFQTLSLSDGTRKTLVRNFGATPREWSRGRLADTGVLANFDLFPGGRRVVALLSAAQPGGDQTPDHATFILNFFEMVRRQTTPPAK